MWTWARANDVYMLIIWFLPALITWLVYGENQPPSHLWRSWLAYLHRVQKEFFSTQNRCHLDLWNWLLDWFSLINSPSSTPSEWESWLLFGLSLCPFFVNFSSCLELFSNSHLIILCLYHIAIATEFGLCSHVPASCLAITRTIWSEPD